MKRQRIKQIVSFALAVPGLLMSVDCLRGNAWPVEMLQPSGDLAVRLMILAMLPGPLVELVGANRVLLAWLFLRRNLGLAAFGYAVLHMTFYVIDMPASGIVGELALPGIWTGWLCLIVLAVPASVSFDAAVVFLGRLWKRMHTLVYAAFALALAHWLLLDLPVLPALLHALPILGVWLARGWKRRNIKQVGTLRAEPDR